ncbi:hypothetical protein Tco_0499333 [Tanacetum coccineum]
MAPSPSPSSIPGVKSDPTDIEYVKLYCRAASGENIDYLRREGVLSDHPSNLYGSLEPRKVHMAWSDSLSDSAVRTIGSGDYCWRDSGPRVLIYEKTGADLAIGFCQKYVLVEAETGMESEWILREYKAFGKQYEQCQSAIYEISFESKKSSPCCFSVFTWFRF